MKPRHPTSKFIVIEGGDGSGKGTQFALLAEHLRSSGTDVLEVDFPQYGKASAYYVERYLNGAYGGVNDVPADLGSLPFALDRFAAKDDIAQHLAKPNSVVIANRYVASNLAHQGTKLNDEKERLEFYRHGLQTEYEILGIPKPDLNIVLLVPSDIAQQNVDKKAPRTYTVHKRDIHEADIDHLKKAKQNYEELCRLYPDEFTAIECVADGELRSIDSIQADIREIVR